MFETGARDFFFLQNAQTASEAHPASNGYRSSFLGVKRPAREVDHWPPSSAEVKNEWSCTSIPRIFPHGMARDFTITFTGITTVSLRMKLQN
jgi:hypothetical protein